MKKNSKQQTDKNQTDKHQPRKPTAHNRSPAHSRGSNNN